MQTVTRMEIQVVISVDEDGFMLNDEVVRRLERRGCEWTSRLARAPRPGCWYLPADGHALRKNPSFVAVVRELNEEYLHRSDMMDWREAKELEAALMGGLRLGEVVLTILIDDEAGREHLNARAVATS